MIRVRFRNGNTAFSEHWIVQDVNNNNVTVLDRTLEPTETYPSEDGGDWLTITSPNGTYGDVQYKRPDQSLWTNRSLIEDMETIDMY